MKIGITERGDAGLDFRWADACQAAVKSHTLDGCVAITKDCNDRFVKTVLELTGSGFPVVVHATCTGWGGTPMEPNVPRYSAQLNQVQKMLQSGFPPSRMVIRIDPIIPTDFGLQYAKLVLDKVQAMNLRKVRFRVSILDGYRHALLRMKAKGYDVSELRFSPTKQQVLKVAALLAQYPFMYETCAEEGLAAADPARFEAVGCVSDVDLAVMGLPHYTGVQNPQNRKGCLCLGCKTELLTACHPCAHQCAYCYWKN